MTQLSEGLQRRSPGEKFSQLSIEGMSVWCSTCTGCNPAKRCLLGGAGLPQALRKCEEDLGRELLCQELVLSHPFSWIIDQRVAQ